MTSVLIATGADRSGLLDDLMRGLLDLGVRPVELRVTSLAGQCAILVGLDADGDAFGRLVEGRSALSEKVGMQLGFADARESTDAGRALDRLTLRGAGNLDALRRASNLLRVLSVNIEEVETGPSVTRVLLRVPPGTPVAKVRELLGQLFANDLNVGWELEQL